MIAMSSTQALLDDYDAPFAFAPHRRRGGFRRLRLCWERLKSGHGRRGPSGGGGDQPPREHAASDDIWDDLTLWMLIH
jgi:hypothetical protein